MSGQRPQIQRELAFPSVAPGNAPRTDGEGPEPFTANRASQDPACRFFDHLGLPRLLDGVQA